jgi:hypothetical protein
LLAAALGVVVTTAATAQNTYQQQITRQLTNAANAIRSQGYNADRAPITGSLNDDADQSQPITLQGGMRYAIVGVCDQDCTDVDLQIFGPDGSKLDEDLELDDTPVLEFVAPVTGQYRLRVMMPSCNQNPCYWGAQVFVK